MELLIGLLLLGGFWALTRSGTQASAPAPTEAPQPPAPRALPARVLISAPSTTPTPTAMPEPEPTAEPEAEPTLAPVYMISPMTQLRSTTALSTLATSKTAPSASPSTSPSAAPTAAPTATPTATPTAAPTAAPTAGGGVDDATRQALITHNVNAVNAYRAGKGISPVVIDDTLSAFALEGSRQLAKDHTPHTHIKENAPSLGIPLTENQGDPNGIGSMGFGDALANGSAQIDSALAMMYAEGPSKDFGKGAAGKGIPMGNHYDHMMDPNFKRVGVGLYYDGTRLYLTNDFSV